MGRRTGIIREMFRKARSAELLHGNFGREILLSIRRAKIPFVPRNLSYENLKINEPHSLKCSKIRA